jgi:hyperosmotically inducible protein
MARRFIRYFVSAALTGIFLSAVPLYADARTDARIFRDAAAVANNYVYFTVFDDIRAAVDEGVVTLSGSVTMPYKAKDIERLVAKLDGVRSVRNEITVLPVSQFDNDLRFRIARAIYGNPSFWRYATQSNPPIHIVVNRGQVTLTGVVQSDVDRMLAQSLASSSSAFSVKNELKTDAEMRRTLTRNAVEK